VIYAGLPVLLAYLVAAFAHGRAADDEARHAAIGWTRGAVVLHGLYLAAVAWVGDLPSFAASWSAVSFGVAVSALALTEGRLSTLSRWLVPAAAALHGVGLVLPGVRVTALDQLGASAWLPIHLALVWAALAGFVAEFCVTVVELVVRRRLKAKKLAGLDGFPALDALARVRLRALGFGVVALALGVGAGAVWASGALPHGSWLADPKVGFTALLWLWYAVAFVVHRASDGHARHAMTWSGVGFGGLLFMFVGLDFVFQGFHGYGG